MVLVRFVDPPAEGAPTLPGWKGKQALWPEATALGLGFHLKHVPEGFRIPAIACAILPMPPLRLLLVAEVLLLLHAWMNPLELAPLSPLCGD